MNATEIPADIFRKITQLFSDAGEQEEVRKIVRELFGGNWGVGPAQLTRSLLVISEGSFTELTKAIHNMEPRDVIMFAEAKSGNPQHYFIPTFDEIEKLK